VYRLNGKDSHPHKNGTQPGLKDELVWDTKVPGFGLKVTPAGSKVILYQYGLGGRGSKFPPLRHRQVRHAHCRWLAKGAERLAML
jgi:hypothetical protein